MAKLGGLSSAGAVILCVGISSCGGSDSGPTVAPTPAPTPPPPEVVLDGNFPLDANFVIGGFFDLSSTGTIDATVDYTFADTMLALFIATGECTFELFAADQCNYIATSFAGPKPRTVSATNQPAGRYTLVIWNLGPQSESFAVQVVFTAQAGAASRAGGRDLSPSGMPRWPAPARRF